MKNLTFEEVITISDKLAKKIIKSGFQPDYLVGIAGGIFPLALLSKTLKIKNIFTLVVESEGEKYKGTNRNKKSTIAFFPKLALENKNILLIDEITESGTTLHQIGEELQNRYPSCIIKTATLGVNKEKCTFYPDYYVFFEKGDWVTFPWEREGFPQYEL